jgi:hypothetical protein
VLTDEATPVEVKVERSNGAVDGWIVKALELELKNVKTPEFAVVLLGTLDTSGMR